MKCRATYVLGNSAGEYAGEGIYETSALPSPSEVTAHVIALLTERRLLLPGMQLRIKTEILAEEPGVVPVFAVHAWLPILLMALTEEQRFEATGLIISLIIAVVCALILAFCRHGQSAEERFAEWLKCRRHRLDLHEVGDAKFEREEETR